MQPSTCYFKWLLITIYLEKAIQLSYKYQESAKGLGNIIEMYMSNIVKQIIACIEVHCCPGHINQELHLYDSSLTSVQSQMTRL